MYLHCTEAYDYGV